jgi:helicase
MTLHSIKNTEDASGELSLLLQRLHEQGPKDPKILETLSFYKEFHPKAFAEIEDKILSALGLFYKIKEPDNLYSFLMSQLGIHHQKKYGAVLTPVQASIRRAVDGLNIPLFLPPLVRESPILFGILSPKELVML